MQILMKKRSEQMANQDTLKLLNETNLGVQMGIYTFDQLLEKIKDPELKKIVTESRNDHKRLKNETGNLLKAYGSYEEKPGLMARYMTWMESSMKTSFEYSDEIAADIITKGCDMGTRKLYRYMNEYSQADPAVKDTSKKLIAIEENLEKRLRQYL